MIRKILKTALLVVGGLALLFYFQFRPGKEIAFGVNFSMSQAGYLGFDWKKMYRDILNELRPKLLRTMAYWEIVEPEKGKYDFSDIDYLLDEAGKHNTQVILVLGLKQPRWPECHAPEWVQKLAQSGVEGLKVKSEKLLNYIRAVVERYKDNEAVYAWQVENEPFFIYGPECGRIPRELYKEEIALVKSLDERPIIVTDSGEKGAWLPTASSGGDIFGSTMYREIYHDKKQKYIKYPIPPALYRVKAGMTKTLTGFDRFIGVELQAEPWFASTDVHNTPWEEQVRHMNPEIFREYVQYARRVGFAQNYFWGVEWWYWAKEKGHPEMWDTAKSIITNH